MKPVRVAVVGAGHLGRIHARILAGLSGATLVAVVDPLEKNRQEVAAQHGVAAHAGHRSVLAEFDAAVIATPTRFHWQVAKELLAAGIHLLVEKPLATTTVQATELVDLARRNGVVLQVGHVERFNPAFAAAEPYLRAPKYIEAVRRSGFSFRSTDIGVVLDLMVHDLDLVLSIVNSPVRRVDALGIGLFGRHEDIVNARLTFENGCVATLSASRASHSAARTLHVWSGQGFAAVDLAGRTVDFVRPSSAVLHGEIDVERLAPDERATLKDTFLQEHLPRQSVPVETADPLTSELTDFVTSIRTGRAPRVTGEAGLEAVKLAERILLEVQTHAWEGSPTGPVGPRIIAPPQILRGPHWHLKPSEAPIERRKAG